MNTAMVSPAVSPILSAILLALLRIRLALMRLGAPVCAAAVLCSCALALWVWLLPQAIAPASPGVVPAPVRVAAAASAAPVADASANLAGFYAALGEQDHVEEQVRTLFALAARSDLQLRQGEYKTAFDPVGRVASYQILLPVKGAYQAVWQFSLDALRAIPFASLDEINFKRDLIADAEPEARVRLTLYLTPTQPIPSTRPGVQP